MASKTLSSELIEGLVQRVRMGAPAELAAVQHGVDPVTLAGWLTRGRAARSAQDRGGTAKPTAGGHSQPSGGETDALFIRLAESIEAAEIEADGRLVSSFRSVGIGPLPSFALFVVLGAAVLVLGVLTPWLRSGDLRPLSSGLDPFYRGMPVGHLLIVAAAIAAAGLFVEEAWRSRLISVAAVTSFLPLLLVLLVLARAPTAVEPWYLGEGIPLSLGGAILLMAAWTTTVRGGASRRGDEGTGRN